MKRRKVAKEVWKGGHVKVNEKVAKASSTVKVNDIIEITFCNKVVKAKVLDIKETIHKEDAKDMFEYL